MRKTAQLDYAFANNLQEDADGALTGATVIDLRASPFDSILTVGLSALGKLLWPVNSNARTGEKAKETSKSQIPIFPAIVPIPRR